LRIRDILSRETRIPPLDLMNLVTHALGMSKEALFVGLDLEIETGKAQQISKFVEERGGGRPLAYITNVKEFYSEEFFVDRRVLVPRPETEHLIEQALRIVENQSKPVSVIDMGTGSGAIGIMMAKTSYCEALCVDISPEALCVAKRNAQVLCPDADIKFVCSNLFDSIGEGMRFDLILANLPYIPTEELAALPADVKDFEPMVALDGGKDGLDVYRRFLTALPRHLKMGGHVLCEIGSKLQSERMEKMLQSISLMAETKKDLSGSERVIIGSWINS
jgi:release factor glutamine methyltransferase